MMTDKVSTTNMSHEEWLEFRKSHIGGSDASAIVGLTPYATQYTVWADKTGKIPPKEDNEAMRLGRDLEDYVAKRFTEATGKKVRRSNYMHFNPQYPFAHANVDRMVAGENAGLECKTTSSLNLKKFRDGNYPATYYAQCVHYMAVTGAERWYLAVLVLGQGFHYYTIERDEDEIQALMFAEQTFWKDYILPDTPPPVDGLDPTSDVLDSIYSASTVNDENLTIYGKDSTFSLLALTKNQLKELEQLKKKYEQEIKEELGEYTTANTDHYTVSWKPQSRKTLDVKQLQAEYPDLDLEPFYKTTTFRKFDIKEI